jgi:DNA-binding protein Fis
MIGDLIWNSATSKKLVSKARIELAIFACLSIPLKVEYKHDALTSKLQGQDICHVFPTVLLNLSKFMLAIITDSYGNQWPIRCAK